MSQIHEKSPKHCAKKQEFNFNKFMKVLFALSILCLIILCFILLLFIIINPKKPLFILKQLNINKLNFTSPSSLNSSIDLTVLSKNPNTRIGIYYEDVILYASYNGQKITPDTAINAFYQDHGQTNLLSSSLEGNQRVVPYLNYQVRRDQGKGKLVLSIKVMGCLRWKRGPWFSSRKRFGVKCKLCDNCQTRHYVCYFSLKNSAHDD